MAWFIEHLKKFKGRLIIQTMFLRGEFKGEKFDNTTEFEVDEWLKALKDIRPQQVMIYSIDRETPAQNVEKISVIELKNIAKKVRDQGFLVSVAE